MNLATIKTLAGRAVLALVLIVGASGLVGHVSAQQLSADCQRLRQMIDDASRGNSGSQYQAAADRQRAELDRTVVLRPFDRLRSRQFLFFGAAPPPQCGEINAQISRMHGNLDECTSAPAAALAAAAN